jgi:hypothetical protein
MHDRIEKQRNKLIDIRRQLAELEKKRSKNKNVPEEWKNEFLTLCRKEADAETELSVAFQDLLSKIALLRNDIIASLDTYKTLNGKKLELEKSAWVNIFHPAQQLRAAKRKNYFYQEEYERILKGIHTEHYESQDELEGDIWFVLANAKSEETLGVDDDLDKDIRQRKSLIDSIEEIRDQDQDEMISLENLEREFRRVVLPRIHPDTSDTPADVFTEIYECYENGDTLIMESYIVAYRGEVEQKPTNGLIENVDIALKTYIHHKRLNKCLESRIQNLKNDLGEVDAENTDKLETIIHTSRREILDDLRKEEEQILTWRDKIEGLVQIFIDWNESGHA